ncbi:hypothetical protein CN884_13930 [Ochrobactrum sp. 30A/1000/2015]|nr:hypothetical protein CN884_13930 [Ochrobactrum sp. 30A/1000/2015]PJT39895.1 hypothetical protein CN883_08690 [Ochrobactrum sp. 27A/999/2015]PJT41076.1 hypothetical protein CN882_23040 [Ochrobactrum sp. 23A/997/2015]
MKALVSASLALLVLSGCVSNRAPDPEYKEIRCKQLLSRTEYPAIREIERVQARTEAAQLGCYQKT